MAKYADLKTYIQETQGAYLQQVLLAFVDKSHDGNGFHSFNVLSLCRQEIDNLTVKSIRCNDLPGMWVKIDVNLTADIIMLGLGTRRYEADRKTRWFTVHITVDLREGFTIDTAKTQIEEYAPGTFDKTTALDEFMVPYVYTADLEDIADDFTEFYCSDAIYSAEVPYAFPYWHVLEQLGLNAYEADLPETTMGRMYFKKDKATVYEKYPYTGEKKYTDKDIEPGTMLISHENGFLNSTQSFYLTVAHEIIHWYYHRKFFRILSLLDSEASMMPCDVVPQKYDENLTGLQKALWFVEWQANAIGMRVAMPKDLFAKAMKEAYASASNIPRFGCWRAGVLEDTIERVASLFGVSRFTAKQRAIQLGLDTAAGACIYIDGRYHSPFSFQEGTLEHNQTFVIDRDGLSKACEKNAVLSELLSSKKFLYLGYVVCINDEQYVKRLKPEDQKFYGCEYDLTDYAREHVDECCLIFNWESRSGRNDDGGFYGQCYLCKDVSAYNRVEHSYNPDFEFNQDTMRLAEEIVKYKVAFAAEDAVKEKMPRTFPGMLKYHMNRKKITVEVLADRSKLSGTTIKKYRAGTSNPEIDNLMALFIGLNLPETYCNDMLDACGLSLNDKTQEQKVYRMLIREHSDGNIDQWNTILKAFGMNTIPNRRNQKISE